MVLYILHANKKLYNIIAMYMAVCVTVPALFHD